MDQYLVYEIIQELYWIHSWWSQKRSIIFLRNDCEMLCSLRLLIQIQSAISAPAEEDGDLDLHQKSLRIQNLSCLEEFLNIDNDVVFGYLTDEDIVEMVPVNNGRDK